MPSSDTMVNAMARLRMAVVLAVVVTGTRAVSEIWLVEGFVRRTGPVRAPRGSANRSLNAPSRKVVMSAAEISATCGSACGSAGLPERAGGERRIPAALGPAA